VSSTEAEGVPETGERLITVSHDEPDVMHVGKARPVRALAL
jgi:hypothetical protein